MLMKPQIKKDVLADFVDNLSGVLLKSRSLLRSAAVKFDELSSDQIINQKRLIEMQDVLSRSNNSQLETVEATVKKEITSLKSWSTVVQKNSSSTPSVKSVQRAVKSVVDQNDRNKNFIVHDDDCEEDKDEDILSEMMDEMYEDECKPQILGFSRIGIRKPGTKRPLKVTLVSRDAAIQVLTYAKKLKKSKYKDFYLAPDRNYEERAAHRKLVAEMKLLIAKEPNKYHYIRQNKIISVDKLQKSDVIDVLVSSGLRLNIFLYFTNFYGRLIG